MTQRLFSPFLIARQAEEREREGERKGESERERERDRERERRREGLDHNDIPPAVKIEWGDYEYESFAFMAPRTKIVSVTNVQEMARCVERAVF